MHIIRSQHPQTWPKLIWERAQTKRKTIEVKKWNISKIQHIYRIQMDLKIHFKTPRCPVDLAAVRLAVAQFPKIQWRRPPANYSIRSQCNLHCLRGVKYTQRWYFDFSKSVPRAPQPLRPDAQGRLKLPKLPNHGSGLKRPKVARRNLTKIVYNIIHWKLLTLIPTDLEDHLWTKTKSVVGP